MSTTDRTGEEVFESLTRFDELAITKAFGTPIIRLAAEDETGLTRALIFTDLRRGGASEKDARGQAFDMPMAQVLDYFADPADELDAEDPDSESGKDD